ncbi:hypothetical protein AALP_AA4G125400 [Arabis alpina]|uniref:Uncharacterized protein n=1 Tax=Arabis alpina TaxID=50452 RepID=A0A087H2U2_ARAAL|nr:hypothetical protein AALP_AA4G125400 [Arabis alpina]
MRRRLLLLVCGLLSAVLFRLRTRLRLKEVSYVSYLEVVRLVWSFESFEMLGGVAG